MNSKNLTTAPLLAAIAVLVMATWALAPGDAHAQVGQLPCVGMPPFAADPVDDAVAVTSVDASVATNDGIDEAIELNWEVGSGADDILCFWIGEKAPGAADFPGPATILVEGDVRDATRYLESGPAGEYCYRVVPITETARGAASETCVEVTNPPAVTSDPQPTPMPTATIASPTPIAPVSGSGVVGPEKTIPWGPIGVGAIFATIATTAALVRRRL